MKIRILSVMLAASVMALTACSGDTVIRDQKEQTTITLSWWGNDARNEYTLEAV